MARDVLERWTCESAADLYGIHNWGDGHFNISEDGSVILNDGRAESAGPSLIEIVQSLREEGIGTPILMRFSSVIRSRIEQLNADFRAAMQEAGYQGQYRGVYPIKVNQHHEVIEDIVEFGRPYHVGLEVGTKAELIVAAAREPDPDAYMVCNGYKDAAFIDLALYAQQFGHNVYLVIELPAELELILARCEKHQVRPNLGIRAKLSTRAGGHWDASGGDRSKFGIDASEIITILDELKSKQMTDCLRMLHYHLGSQVPNIRRIRTAVQEAACVYAGLVSEGAPMGTLNVGGGLAVDYNGSHSNSASSCNYSGAEYAADIIEGVMRVMDENDIAHPTLVSESGRALTAHHAVLVFNVLDSKRLESPTRPPPVPEDADDTTTSMREVYSGVSPRNVQEAFHDAVFYRDEIRNKFIHGAVSLRERARCEDVFWRTIRRIQGILSDLDYVPEELQDLNNALSDHYYGNFSVFQSLPDTWAVGQTFPVMPIHRLHQRPTRPCVLADITCDSDGKLDRFPDLHADKGNLLLHEMNSSAYYLGVFLVGAYQETLGDMHNLLGDVNVVQIRSNREGEQVVERRIIGDTIAEILSYNEFNITDLMSRIRACARAAVVENRLTPEAEGLVLKAYEAGLHGYTYFET